MTFILAMDSITEALVKAGYYRARISTLSDFDKIIGGIAWSLQVFSHDININIFYADTLALGQKIALTERLVMVILVMNCPFQIEPHQIVGLDYDNILPVIRWLIKRSAEVRREHEAFNRLIALRHFHRMTNGSLDRASWSHIVPIDQLKKFNTRRSSVLSESPKDGTGERPVGSGKLEDLMSRLNEQYKDNQKVSFLNLPSMFMANAQRSTNAFSPDEDNLTESSDDHQEDVEEAQVTITEPTVATDQIEAQSEDVGRKNLEPESDLVDAESIEAHKELDAELLATNQKILNLLKKLDSMPSEMEISQYQRRYIELHRQLTSNNKDLKKLFAHFNALDNTKHYLGKEINLLDSISSNLELTNRSASNREQFLVQFQTIILKIQTVKESISSQLKSLQDKCESLNADYSSRVN